MIQPPTCLINRHPNLRLSLRSLKKKIERILQDLNLEGSSLQVTLAGDAMLRRENRKHRGYDQTTDVLSFPAFPSGQKRAFYAKKYLGDILISLDRAQWQAKTQKITLADEVLFLVIHSILHLIGHDHAKPKETRAMQKMESKLWGLFHDKF